MVPHDFLQLCIILRDFKECILNLFSNPWVQWRTLLRQQFPGPHPPELIFLSSFLKQGGLEHWNRLHVAFFCFETGHYWWLSIVVSPGTLISLIALPSEPMSLLPVFWELMSAFVIEPTALFIFFISWLGTYVPIFSVRGWASIVSSSCCWEPNSLWARREILSVFSCWRFPDNNFPFQHNLADLSLKVVSAT